MSLAIDLRAFLLDIGNGMDAEQTIADIERLERDEFDLVAVGRSLIVNPTWPAVIRRGAIEELKPFQRDVLVELV